MKEADRLQFVESRAVAAMLAENARPSCDERIPSEPPVVSAGPWVLAEAALALVLNVIVASKLMPLKGVAPALIPAPKLLLCPIRFWPTLYCDSSS